MSFVVVMMGSKSDWQIMKECVSTLDKFDIKYEVYITSAHRSPEQTRNIVLDSQNRGAKAFIAAAGMAAHLAGAVAALTTKPVIAVPLQGGIIDGLDSLLSSVQMPKGMPVATMSVGKAGAINAAYFVAQIFSTLPEYAHISKALLNDREGQVRQLQEDTKNLLKELNSTKE